ncbi:MAG TPA: AraC family transcriptional regulator ligand-binding domain-containing protein, partial [Polyangiaceae bacterium]|nr:AraC family transcriptional regulator ligand-binding domain-containing protein [Polyangiaceae bacterium]
MATWVPAITVEAALEAFRELGLDERRLRAEANVTALGLDSGALLSSAVWEQLWSSVHRELRRDELALQAGLALPFGAFGLVDYLAASADTLGASCEALAQHFHRISCETSLEIEERPGEYRLELVVTEAAEGTLAGEEFTLGTLVGR